MSLSRPNFTTKTFWLNTAERAVRTAAQSAVALLLVDGLPVSRLDIDLAEGAWTVTLATVLSILTALAGKAVGDPDSPSFVLAAPPKAADVAPSSGGSTFGGAGQDDLFR